MQWQLAVVMLVATVCSWAADSKYPSVMAEANLERRSELALTEADKAVTAAKQAYEDRKSSEFSERLGDVRELVELSYQSLEDTGKKARRKPRFFKRAELKMRMLLRRLTSLSTDVAVEHRPTVEEVKTSVNSVHDKLIHALMTEK